MRFVKKLTKPLSLMVVGSFLALVVGHLTGLSAHSEDAITLQGTGATFPAPLYQRWFAEYDKLHPNVQINYQALGSC